LWPHIPPIDELIEAAASSINCGRIALSVALDLRTGAQDVRAKHVSVREFNLDLTF
jgi:hypothetical protein